MKESLRIRINSLQCSGTSWKINGKKAVNLGFGRKLTKFLKILRNGNLQKGRKEKSMQIICMKETYNVVIINIYIYIYSIIPEYVYT